MPIGSSFICFLAFWHVTHTEVYSLTPLKFNLGWLNTHVEVYITEKTWPHVYPYTQQQIARRPCLYLLLN